MQILGSFKVRGGLNLISSLSSNELSRGVITASTGNHGQSIAFSARTVGARSIIVVPHGANPHKVTAMKDLGADVLHHGRYFEDAREHAEQLAIKNGYRYVHPANEPLLVAGVGTYALEILEDVGEVDNIIIPLGAGSGAAGACIAASALSPSTGIIAVQASEAPAAFRAWQERRPVEAEMNTEAEGLATGSSYELPQTILRALLHDFWLVSEEEILRALRLFVESTHTLVEGAAAAVLAAALKENDRLTGKRVVLVASGANVSSAPLARAFAC